MSRMLRRRIGGFSLLEIMIAMAILSGALVWLIVGVSRNIRAENHAKLMTAATFLARGKMVDIEDDLYKKGFGEFEKELNGTFDDKGFSRYTWRAIVDKIELPTVDQLQSVLTKAQQGAQQVGGAGSGGPGGGVPGLGGDSSPLGGLLGGGAGGALGGASGGSSGSSVLGAGAGMLAGQFGMIKDVLEQAIRRVTVKIGWIENGKPQEVELVAFYTDVRRVDQAIQIASAPGGAGGSGGTGGGGSGGRP